MDTIEDLIRLGHSPEDIALHMVDVENAANEREFGESLSDSEKELTYEDFLNKARRISEGR